MQSEMQCNAMRSEREYNAKRDAIVIVSLVCGYNITRTIQREMYYELSCKPRLKIHRHSKPPYGSLNLTSAGHQSKGSSKVDPGGSTAATRAATPFLSSASVRRFVRVGLTLLTDHQRELCAGSDVGDYERHGSPFAGLAIVATVGW
jgi:hypothetical protein